LGVFGAAVSWGTAIVIMNALPLTQILFRPGAHPFGRATLLAMGMSTLCFGAIPWLARQLSTSSFTASMTGLTMGLLGYVAFLVIARRTLHLSTLLQALRIRGRGRIPVT
ncbi:MAG: multi antimicrobial extrusion protein MatE, partial [Actinomycetia bacterium]|nr:multi antimicrobial extrusion protein MatE [Actinomycetes bacterium]